MDAQLGANTAGNRCNEGINHKYEAVLAKSLNFLRNWPTYTYEQTYTFRQRPASDAEDTQSASEVIL